MCSLQGLKVFVQQRLTAAVEEIFGHFEKTITEYEEEIHRRHRRLLDEVLKPDKKLRKAECPADVQQLLENREEVPCEQQDPEPPHIKEEEEELWTSQEGEQLQGLVGVDIPSSPVSVKKSEDDEEPSQLHQSQTEKNRDFVGGSEPASNVSIAEYEEELSRSKEENERQRKLLDAVFNPQLQLHRADVQQLLESKEEVPPEQQEWSSSLDQQDPEPPHIKEEQEELWTSQEGEQLQGLEEADITTFTLTLVPVKSEDDEEKPQSSQLHQRQTEQMETEADGEDCGGSEPDPDKHLQPVSDDKTSDTPETDVIDDWTESRKHRSLQMLRAVVDQRLTAAAEEIFVLFERSIAEYEEELSRSKEENERQRKLLDAVFNPQLQLHRADVQQLLESKEEVPTEQQERSSSLDQEDPEPPHIKEEQEELWTSEEGEQLQGLEEADITTFTLTLVPMTSEDDEEKPQSSQLHQRQTEQMKTEADGEDCGGSEPARNSDPDRHLQSDDNKMSDSSETDISDETPKNKEKSQ
eukprot:superscaffoldBa00003645_g17387